MLPPYPGWDGLHPLIVHFPVGLLLTTPIFVVLAILWPSRQTFGFSALVTLVLGTLAAFIAVETGEAAAELATRTEAINAAIEAHASLAETARNLFAVLTLLYIGILLLPRFATRLRAPRWLAATQAVFLVLVLAGGVVVANAAHRGGVLVHRHGVQAMLPPEP